MIPKSFEVLTEIYLNPLVGKDSVLLSENLKYALMGDIQEFTSIHTNTLELNWYRKVRSNEILENIFRAVVALTVPAKMYSNFGDVYEELDISPTNEEFAMSIELGRVMQQSNLEEDSTFICARKILDSFYVDKPERRG